MEVNKMLKLFQSREGRKCERLEARIRKLSLVIVPHDTSEELNAFMDWFFHETQGKDLYANVEEGVACAHLLQGLAVNRYHPESKSKSYDPAPTFVNNEIYTVARDIAYHETGLTHGDLAMNIPERKKKRHSDLLFRYKKMSEPVLQEMFRQYHESGRAEDLYQRFKTYRDNPEINGLEAMYKAWLQEDKRIRQLQ